MFSKIRFTTHVININADKDLTIQDLDQYFIDNDISPKMQKRLRVQWFIDHPVGRQMDIYEAIDIARQKELNEM